jgi:hypothetical protein
MAAIVTQFAEPVRGPYAAVTAPVGLELAGAAQRGIPGGVPISTSLATGPYTAPSSVGASQVLQWRDENAAGRREPDRPPFVRRFGSDPETPEKLTQRIMMALRSMGVVAGLLTEEGMKDVKLEELRGTVRRLLADPQFRQRIFRP